MAAATSAPATPTGPGEQTWIRSKHPSPRQRLHRGGQARHPDLQARVVGHVELGHGRQAPVDVRVGAEDLDLEARHAALADLLDRARHPVGGADAVGQDRHTRDLAVVARASVSALAVVLTGCARDRVRDAPASPSRWRGTPWRVRTGWRRCSSRTGRTARGTSPPRRGPRHTACSTAPRSLRSCRREARR